MQCPQRAHRDRITGTEQSCWDRMRGDQVEHHRITGFNRELITPDIAAVIPVFMPAEFLITMEPLFKVDLAVGSMFNTAQKTNSGVA